MGVESIKLLLTSDGTNFYRDAYINVFKKWMVPTICVSPQSEFHRIQCIFGVRTPNNVPIVLLP